MNKEISELFNMLEPTIGGLNKKLGVLAVLNLAKEFYSDEERKSLYAHYVVLQAEDRDAFEAISNAAHPENLGWEKRVEKYGKELAKEQIAPMLAAMDKRKDTSNALNNFRDEHGLIVKLVEYKSLLAQW